MHIQIEELTASHDSFVKRLNQKIDLEAKAARDLPPMHFYTYQAVDGKREIGGIFGFDNFGALHIEGIWVHPDYRRRGVGRRLVLRAEELAKERSCKSVILFTMDFQAPLFYQSLGYREEFRRTAYHKGSIAIYMIKELQKPSYI